MLLSNAVRRAGRKAQRNEGGNAERQKVWKAGWLASVHLYVLLKSIAKNPD